ncbi:hypothetical protein [Cohnella faecalis]|uniref:Uncharacterized protein n=1 Tax=Cohnella faecalis TaxID=2315694 RepID=A0A398CXP8_9BACL|nr:hypothetical protein [Cohnella faecalis]RIE05308.1 hypothetical protein D3H35_01285 [Cohnella faecalis]
MLKNSKIKEHLPSKRFTSFLEWNLRFKWLPILIAFLLLLGSVGTYFSLPKGAIDNSSASSLSITLDYKPDTPVDEVRKTDSSSKSF